MACTHQLRIENVNNDCWHTSEIPHHDLFVPIVQEAARRSARQGRGILASYTWPIGQSDPISALNGAQQTGLGDCFFWEQPTQHQALMGIGSVANIVAQGNNYIHQAAEAWRMLLQEAVVRYAPGVLVHHGNGPMLVGGFAFDPLTPRTELWQSFPDGLLILPQLLLSYHAGDVTLTVNRLIQAVDDIEQCVHEMQISIAQLLDRISHPALVPAEDNLAEEEQALNVQDMRPVSEWTGLVSETIQAIQAGVYEKVMLARAARIIPKDANSTFDVSSSLRRLRQSYAEATIFAVQRGRQVFVGATPERLAKVQDGIVRTMALAGSAPRGTSDLEDQRRGTQLLQSLKDAAEHAIVVTSVTTALKSHCTHVHVSDMPHLLKLKNVQHLETSIVGELIPGQSILDVIADLHPTAAVGGFPRQEALEAIRHREKLDRGWYAGPVGWIGADGQGEFVVALRSGIIGKREATLFAGCGIVSDSHPLEEYEESNLKMRPMLHSLVVCHP